MKCSLVLALVGSSALVLAGCSSGLAVPGMPAASPKPKVYITAPLTGVKYEEGTPQALQLAKPSVACKIDNGSLAPRPQSGLNSTDIVFDEMVEGGLTRIVAIWHSAQPDGIGPVRSIRPMDPDILSPFGGIVCFSGGQQAFVNAINAAPVFTASETTEQGKGTFSRSSDRIAPHNVIVNVQKLANDHLDLAAPPAQFSFAADLTSSSAILTGIPVSKVTVNFPQAQAIWTPSADAAFWQRTQDGQPLTDKLDGEQIHAVNVVVMQVKIDRSYLDKRYGNVPKTVMIGSGSGWVFSGGNALEIGWSKASATSPIVLTDPSGQVVQLAPGNTWVELQPVAPEGKTIIVKAPVKTSPTPSVSPTK